MDGGDTAHMRSVKGIWTTEGEKEVGVRRVPYLCIEACPDPRSQMCGLDSALIDWKLEVCM